MSNWLSKSDQSFSIANNNDPAMLNNRVHCFYYGCVQYLFHLLHVDKKMTEQEISDKCNPNVNKGNGGTHTWLAQFFFNDLKNKTFVLEGVSFNNKIGMLKRLRTDADYGLNDINEDQLKTAKEISETIIKILKRRYTNDQPNTVS